MNDRRLWARFGKDERVVFWYLLGYPESIWAVQGSINALTAATLTERLQPGVRELKANQKEGVTEISSYILALLAEATTEEVRLLVRDSIESWNKGPNSFP